MSEKLRKKALILAALVVISLLVMGVFLTTMQSRLALSGHRSDMEKELSQVSEVLDSAQQERTETTRSYDAVYQSKAGSVAFMAQNDVDYEETNAKMAEYQSLLQVNNVLVLDRQGTVLAAAEDTPAQFTYARYNQLRTVFETGQPSEAFEVQIGDVCYRYYGARIDDEKMAVVEQDPEELHTLLDDTVSQASVLNQIGIGREGYVFTISAQNYVIGYHPSEELTGADGLDAGIEVGDLEDGNFAWMTLDGEQLYCGVSQIGDTYYIAAIPEAEIEASRNVTVGIILFIFFAVMTIVVTYSIFVMREEEKKNRGTEKEAASGIKYNRQVGKKAAILSVIGLLAILLISYYMQTLFALSSQSISNRQRVEGVESTLTQYGAEAELLQEQYNERYLNKCQIAAYILEHKPELQDKEKLQELADVLQVQYVYQFDSQGRTAATNAAYSGFQISDDPEDQSYEFNRLLTGTEYLIQEAQPDDISGDVYQYIGVSLYDEEGNADGFVQIGLRAERLEEIQDSMRIDNILDGIKVGVNGFAFAVNKEDQTFAYYPEEKLIGRSAKEYGMEEDQFTDGYNDYMAIRSEKYLASSLETDDYYIYVVIPDSEIMSERIPLTLAAGGLSLICLVVLFLILAFDRQAPLKAKVAENEEKNRRKGTDDKEDKAEKKGERMIQVSLPDGRKKTTEAAASRWMNLAIAWDEKTPEQQILTVIRWLFTVLALAICVGVLGRRTFFGEDSVFTHIVEGQWSEGLNVFAATACVMLISVVMTGTALLRSLLRILAEAFGARGETVCRMISSFIKYVSIIVLLYYCFAMFGVDTQTLLASAGILSIAISFGAKELVSDILSGLFIIFEGEFRVGDIIMIGDWRGTVIEIGVRTTKVEDGSNNIKIIRNSNVTDVVNMTRRGSYASCDIGIEYGESLERVESILEAEFPRMKRELPAILGGPYYKGVIELGANSVDIRVIAECAEEDRVQLERDLMRELKLIFDEYEISIPYPQIVVNEPAIFKKKATALEKAQAKRFNEEQRTASRHLGNEDDDTR